MLWFQIASFFRGNRLNGRMDPDEVETYSKKLNQLIDSRRNLSTSISFNLSFILKTINSILNQSYKNFEILIIYDDSDLKDLKFIKKFVGKDKRVKIFLNKKNIGVSKSRNFGIKKSKGKFITFITKFKYLILYFF